MFHAKNKLVSPDSADSRNLCYRSSTLSNLAAQTSPLLRSSPPSRKPALASQAEGARRPIFKGQGDRAENLSSSDGVLALRYSVGFGATQRPCLSLCVSLSLCLSSTVCVYLCGSISACLSLCLLRSVVDPRELVLELIAGERFDHVRDLHTER